MPDKVDAHKLQKTNTVASAQTRLGIARDWKKSPAVAEAKLPSQFLYAIGDLHGDFDNALKLLESAGIIEKGAKRPEDVKWKAGAATLACTGDLIDKGKQSVQCLQLMMALQASAAKAGGQVVVTMGNHEMEFLSLATSNKFAKKDDDQTFIDDLNKLGVYKDFMIGKDKLGPGGTSMGQWLQNLPVGAKLGNFFFCHAGSTSHKTVADIEKAVEAGVDNDGWGTKFLSADDSMLEARKEFWGKAGHDEIKQDAAALGVDYIFYGHDPSKLQFPNNEKREACQLFSHFDGNFKDGILRDQLFGIDTCNSSWVQKDQGVKDTGRLLRITLNDGGGAKRGRIDAFDSAGNDKKYDQYIGSGG